MLIISEELINWYQHHKRDLPWRKSKDPYKIWLSEIILQQTRVEQGLPYYYHFIEKYPTIEALANASEEQVLKSWQGLGYYSRARNLQFTAKEIVSNLNANFPNTYNELIKLKGIGEYTAAAISSFAFNEKRAVVDGNVFRFLSRLYKIDLPINSSVGKKEFTKIANELIDPNQPGLFNQAIMEFGSMLCKPKPNCEHCPFQTNCLSFSDQTVLNFPVKINKVKVRERYFHYFHIKKNNAIYLNKRIEKDIWQNLFELPKIEVKQRMHEAEVTNSAEWQAFFENEKFTVESISPEHKHVLTHQRIFAKFWQISISPNWHKKQRKFALVKDEELMNFALPRLIEQYFQKNT